LVKNFRKALISGILLMIGIIMIIAPFTFMNDLLFFEFSGIFVGSLGMFFIISSVAYWYFIWPDEFESGKETQEDDLVVDIEEGRNIPRSWDSDSQSHRDGSGNLYRDRGNLWSFESSLHRRRRS
jgi:amino acid transporter